MNWKDAGVELPPNGRRVLISVRGTFHLATYSKALQAFRLDEGSVFMAKYHDIYWLDMRSLQVPGNHGQAAVGQKTEDDRSSAA